MSIQAMKLTWRAGRPQLATSPCSAPGSLSPGRYAAQQDGRSTA
jgi:hypothetical protein